MQIVAMCLKPWEDTWHDMHEKQDVLIRIERWEAVVEMDGFDYTLSTNMAIVVPVGSKHNTKNMSKTDMLYMHVVYAMPHHTDYKIHHTKADAEKEKPLTKPASKIPSWTEKKTSSPQHIPGKQLDDIVLH